MELEDRLGHVFPQNWNVSERMAVQFCELTSRMVADLLSQRSAELDVKLLLYAIQRTTVFEEQLSKRYTGVTINGTSDDNRESTNPFEEQGSDYNSEGNPDGSNSQSELSETKLDKKLEQKKNNPFNKDRFDLFSRNLFDHKISKHVSANFKCIFSFFEHLCKESREKLIRINFKISFRF